MPGRRLVAALAILGVDRDGVSGAASIRPEIVTAVGIHIRAQTGAGTGGAQLQRRAVATGR